MAKAESLESVCSNPFKSTDAVLFAKEYPFYQSKQQVEASFQSMLVKGERLEYRGMILKSGQYMLPLVSLNVHGLKEPTDWVALPDTVSQSVVQHLREAFLLGYALYPFFSDMGHGHLYLPPEKAQKLEQLKLGKVERWNDLLNDPDLLILYHATEKYDFSNLSDPQISFLYKHRNIVGSIKNATAIKTLPGPGGEMNTVNSIPGFVASGVLNFSVSKKGCVPFLFKGEELFLDFSFQGLSTILPPATNSSLQK